MECSSSSSLVDLLKYFADSVLIDFKYFSVILFLDALILEANTPHLCAPHHYFCFADFKSMNMYNAVLNKAIQGYK